MSSYPANPLGMRMLIAPGADLTAHPSTYTWQEITRDLSLSRDISHTKGRADEQGQTNSSSKFSLRNPVGRYTSDYVESDLFPFFTLNCPVRFDIDLGDGSGWTQRFIHYASDLADQWPSGNRYRCITTVQAAGLFRRLGQGEILSGSMERAVLAESTLQAYWKMYDGAVSAGGFGSSLPNGAGSAMVLYDSELYLPPEYRAVAQPPGGGDDRAARMNGTIVRTPTLSVAAPWSLEVAVRRPADGSADGVGVVTFLFDSDNPAASAVSIALVEDTDVSERDWYHYYVTGTQVGAETVISAWRNGLPRPGQTFLATTLGALTGVVALGTAGFDDGDDLSMAELAVYSGAGVDYEAHSSALQAWAGERARARIERIGAEEGIPVDVSAGTDLSAIMGVQPRARALSIFRDCEQVDGGILDDSQGTAGYRALHEMHNQDPAFTADGALREIFLPFTPKDNDLKRKNRIKAVRPAGGEATVEDLDDINGIVGFRPAAGVYEGTLTVNVDAVAQLRHHAGSAVRRGTIRGKRYPGFTLDLLRAPQLARPWLDMSLGDVSAMINPPLQHAKGEVRLLLTGATETWRGRRKWRVVANADRADWLEVVEVGATDGPGNNRGRVGLRNCTLAAELRPGITTASIACAGTLWRTGSGLNHDLDIGGERVTVTAISGGSSPQTATIVRTLPGKTHRAGTPVQLWRIPAYAR